MFPPENPLNVPIVQISIFDNEDPNMHFSLGKAVAALREQGVVVICSGMAVSLSHFPSLSLFCLELTKLFCLEKGP